MDGYIKELLDRHIKRGYAIKTSFILSHLKYKFPKDPDVEKILRSIIRKHYKTKKGYIYDGKEE